MSSSVRVFALEAGLALREYFQCRFLNIKTAENIPYLLSIIESHQELTFEILQQTSQIEKTLLGSGTKGHEVMTVAGRSWPISCVWTGWDRPILFRDMTPWLPFSIWGSPKRTWKKSSYRFPSMSIAAGRWPPTTRTGRSGSSASRFKATKYT